MTVTSISDALHPGDGCTLRGAVAAINQGRDANGCRGTGYGTSDTIIFDESLAGQTLRFSVFNGEIQVDKTLVIAGPPSAQVDYRRRVILQGDDSGSGFRLLNVADSSGSLTVMDLDFSKATILGGDGGAIKARSAPVNVLRCQFASNAALNGDGGAIYSKGELRISNSRFFDNRSQNGGAIAAKILDIDASVLFSNTTLRATNGGYGGYGGAVWAEIAKISNSSFNGNSSTSYGGAIVAGTLDVSASTFNNNSGESKGGALYVYPSMLNVDRSVFTGNSAFSGGAIYVYAPTVINASTFVGNTAEWGGAIDAADLSVSVSTFRNNAARWGGAIGSGYSSGNFDISASTFIGNSATEEGGGIYAGHNIKARHLTLFNNIAAQGAAIYLWNYGDNPGGTADIADSLIVGNNNGPQCAREDGAAFTGSYNLGWRKIAGAKTGLNDTSCGSAHFIDASTSTQEQIVAAELADQGGPTQTLALPAGSPAIAQADKTGSSQMLDPHGQWVDAVFDQRGYPRRDAAAGRDLGAFEQATDPLPQLTMTLMGSTIMPVVGAAYNGYMKASGGTGEYTFTLDGGDLPPGLTLNSDGTFGGTAKQAGFWIFSVVVRDSGIPSASKTGRVALLISNSGNRTEANVVVKPDGLTTAFGAFVPPEADDGKPGAIFVFARLPGTVAVAPDTVWVMDTWQTWHLFAGCQSVSAIYDHYVQRMDYILIFPEPVDTRPYAGSELYIGYGVAEGVQMVEQACNDMLVRQSWTQVYTEPTNQ